jgi:MtrB/PioB family decaheme-associated outer membrane protein
MRPPTSYATALVIAALYGSARLLAQGQPPAEPPPAQETQAQASGTPAQDATQAGTLFPVWSLQSNRNIDPRVRPNAGLRTPMAYYPIAGGPMFYPTFSPVAPDFLGVQATTPWSVRGSLALFGMDNQRASSKLQEFRDLRDGVTAGLEAHYREGRGTFNLIGRQLGRGDQDLTMDGGTAGIFQWSMLYDETPHNYAFGARSLYSGAGTDALTIAPSIRRDVQNSASVTDAAAKLNGYVSQSAQSVDEALRRQKVGGDVTLVATYPFVAKASFSNESRDGVRPWSGSFGFGEYVEVPWPVKYDTRELRVTGEWAKPEGRVYASGSYRLSDFIDHYASLTFDNPVRVTDSASPVGSYDAGPAAGRIALYPSNLYHEASGTIVVKKLPMHATFNALVSFGFMRQNEPLIPYSTNTSDVLTNANGSSFNATDLRGLPRLTAETSMNTQTVHAQWTGEPFKRVRLTGQYRLSKLDNHETPFTFSAFVREDQDPRPTDTPGGTFRALPIAYATQTATSEASYNFSRDSRVGLAYTFGRTNRDFREVAWTNDHKMKASFDTRRFGPVELKSWYQFTKRSTAPYLFNQSSDQQGDPLAISNLPYLRKFDEAPYHRHEAQGMVTWHPTDAASLSGHGEYVATNFTESNAGVLWDRRQVYGLDFSYTPTDRLSLFADAGFERTRYEQASRQWFPLTFADPFTGETGLLSNSNWTATPRDHYYSAGLGLDVYLIDQKLRLNAQYTFSKSAGRHDYTSPLGTPANDLNPFVPLPFTEVDNTLWHTFNPELEYKWSRALSLALGYHYEKWTIRDYNYNGFSYVDAIPANFPFPPGIALLMGGLLPPGYNANVLYVRIKAGI